jgi:uncharacterized protein (DUF433 family)
MAAPRWKQETLSYEYVTAVADTQTPPAHGFNRKAVGGAEDNFKRGERFEMAFLERNHATRRRPEVCFPGRHCHWEAPPSRHLGRAFCVGVSIAHVPGRLHKVIARCEKLVSLWICLVRLHTGWLQRLDRRRRAAGYRVTAGATSRKLEAGGSVMAALDWSNCPAVESVPGKMGGAWVFKGTRLPVATVIENLEDLSVDEVMEQFDVTREQVTAVLEFVADSLRSEVPAGARPV